MLELILTYLAEKLEATSYFEKVHCYAEKIKDGKGKSYPVPYISDGQYSPINLEGNGIGYFRKTQAVGISDKKDQIACSILKNFLIRFRLVACVPKIKVVDNAFATENLVQQIIKSITEASGDLSTSLTAVVTIKEEKYETDRQRILTDEYSEVPLTDVPYKYSYFSIDFLADVLIAPECLPDPCPEPAPRPEPEPEPDCLFLSEFNTEQEAIDQGWLWNPGEWGVSGGKLCSSNIGQTTGFFFPDYQDGTPYTLTFDFDAGAGGDAILSVVAFGEPAVAFTTSGTKTINVTGSLGDNLVLFTNDSGENSTVICIDNVCII